MIAVGFPTQYEASDFLAALSGSKPIDGAPIFARTGKIGEQEVAVGILGIGAEHAPKNALALLKVAPSHTFLLAGFAGALIPELQRGHILLAQGYSSEDMVNFIRALPGFDIARLHSSPTLISTAAEKARLARETECQMVDMETSFIAQAIRPMGIDLVSIRAISDLSNEDLPAELLSKGYDYASAQATPIKMAFHLALRPGEIKKLKAFLDPLPAVRKKLTAFLVDLIKDF